MPHRKTMNVSLTPELEAFVGACVSSGRYRSNSEVMRAALRLLQVQEHRETAVSAVLPSHEPAQLAARSGPSLVANGK
ncbi:type II toxin-antitoxin system ParD family antitoxin [Methylobacterium segetis]|uniref:type II toxin-antitoxin system ParD family antitoxin n=1 Tax=Methylobacterium segetis TaxID=2488750 RepID=UPI001A9E8323|nr:type II toxin-antitoxin system ParD family antitoxin [Methylobacterium segetis]